MSEDEPLARPAGTQAATVPAVDGVPAAHDRAVSQAAEVTAAARVTSTSASHGGCGGDGTEGTDKGKAIDANST